MKRLYGKIKPTLGSFTPKRTGGLIVPRYCTCGKYKAKSRRGIIDTDCRNCGGERKPVVFGTR